MNDQEGPKVVNLGSVIRHVILAGLVLSGLVARGETAVDFPGGKGFITGWFDLRGSWTVFAKWAGSPSGSFDVEFTPSGLVYEGGQVFAAWSQAGLYMNWQEEDGTLYRGRLLSNYSMTGTMSLVSSGSGTWTATRSYAPGVFSFLNASNTAEEGTKKVVYVYRTCGNDGVASVDYAVIKGTALPGQDYASKSGTLTWQNKDSVSKVIKIPILHDGPEGYETFSIVLKKPVNGYLGTPVKTTVYILPPQPGSPVANPVAAYLDQAVQAPAP